MHVQPDASARPRLDAAVALAAREGAHLIGVAAEAWGLGVSMAGEQFDVASRNLAAASAAFREAAAGLSHEVIALEANPVQAVCAAAVGVDYIVAGGAADRSSDPYRTCDPAVLALKSGRPLLVAPPEGGELKADAVIVAWKDTREARRALADAMPFLSAARKVVVLESAMHGGREAAQQRVDGVAARLARIGVTARPIALEGAPDDVVPNIQAEANIWEADLIVCGAYGHSRFGEWVFGGVTADLLADPQQFLLLSH